MAEPHIAEALAREIAAVALQRAARQYATVVGGLAGGECSPALLRTRQRALEAAALAYAAAHSGQAPGEAPP